MRTLPLIGRDVELARLGRALDTIGSPGAAVTGPAGVGKTALVAAVVDAGGRTARRVQGTRSSRLVPFGAFAPLLPREGLGGDGQHATLARAHDAIVDAVTSTGPRSALFVDDAHALDDASATVLLQLVLERSVKVVITVRSDEELPDAIRAVMRDGGLEHLVVEPLPDEAMEQLLDLVLPEGCDGATTRHLLRRSAGNPLLLVELVPLLVRDGRLRARDGGVWMLEGDGALASSSGLAGLIGDRLDQLTPPERDAMDLASLGDPLPTSCWDDLGLGAAAERLEETGLVTVRVDGARRVAAITHPLHAEVSQARMGDTRRRRLLGQLIAWHEDAGPRRREDLRRVAVWRLERGEEADAAALVDAARDAFAGGDFALATRLVSAAHQRSPTFESGVLLGRCLDGLGDHDGAERVLTEVQTVVSDSREAARLARVRSSNLHRGLGRVDEAEAVADEARRAQPPGPERDAMTAQLAIAAVLEGRVDRVLSLCAEVESDDDVAMAMVGLPLATASTLAGRVETAEAVATRALELIASWPAGSEGPSPESYRSALTLALSTAGSVAAAREVAEQSYAEALSSNNWSALAWSATDLGRVAWFAGDLPEAIRRFREAAAVFEAHHHPGVRWGLGGVAMTAGQAGEVEVATAAVDWLDALEATPVELMDGEVTQGRAWARFAAGDLVGARATLADAVAFCRERGLVAQEISAWHDLARLGAAADLGRLGELAGRVEGALLPLRVRLVGALASGDADELEACATTLEAMGCLLWAAEAFQECAVRSRAAGEPRRAAAMERRSAGLAERCGSPRTPLLAANVDQAALLSKREREVAELVATGMSNRAVADALHLSVRTVENHLQRAYAKLGVADRAGLAAAIEAP